MLSTTLYRAWISMETIIGPDMVRRSRRMGMTPILFSWGGWTGPLTEPPLPGRIPPRA